MVRQLQSVDAQSESEKKRKKLQKALRQIDDLKEKEQQGVKLEKTQQGKSRARRSCAPSTREHPSSQALKQNQRDAPPSSAARRTFHSPQRI